MHSRELASTALSHPARFPMRPRRAVLRVLTLAIVTLAAFGLASAAEAGKWADASGWQADELGLPQAWQLTHGNPSVIVAVVDTGAAADHPALAGRVLPGYDFVNNDADAGDDNGHGTALAGIVASTCPACRILPVKVLGANMTGDWGTIAAGVTWAADHGAQVINLSIGAPRAPDSLGAAIADALAKGVIVVAAAGNDGHNETFYPAMYPGVVSVAGIDENSARYQWSNFGSWVTVAAPGCTTAASLGGGYEANFCGTSTAAPFVAGVAGLARALDPSLTPDQFRRVVAASSDPLRDGTTASAGRVDAGRLLQALDSQGAAPVETVSPTIPRTATRGRPITATVGVWQEAVSYAIRWQCSHGGAKWEDIGKGPSYAPTGADVGCRLRIVVTASNASGSTTATSAPDGPVHPHPKQPHPR
jgi:subtilisin family serine protease